MNCLYDNGWNSYYEVDGDKGTVVMWDKKRQASTMIDAQYWQDLSRYRWSCYKDGYWKSTNRIYLHRLILALNLIHSSPEKPYTDHINRDKNDNRVQNLRWVTPSESNYNRVMPNSTGSTFVYKIEGRKKPYQVRIRGELLGYYSTFGEALVERNKFCKDNNISLTGEDCHE